VEQYKHDLWLIYTGRVEDVPIRKELMEKLSSHDEVIEIVQFHELMFRDDLKYINGTAQLERLRGKLELLEFDDPGIPNYFEAFMAVLDQDEIPEEVWGMSTFYHWPDTTCYKIL
jgi:hypothetical protein